MRGRNGKFRRHGTGVDHGGDGIGRIMKTVDELEAERQRRQEPLAGRIRTVERVGSVAMNLAGAILAMA